MNNKRYTVEDWMTKGKMGRHETFTPRYGWLKKGYDAVSENGNIFKVDNAIERLGVGKNMVRSMRFWCQAFNLIEPGNNNSMKATDLGDRLLADDGWDPFLEDIASLWLLHWQLFIPPIETISWPLAFNNCNLWSFEVKQLGQIIYNAAQKYSTFDKIKSTTFEKDASCIIRMYTASAEIGTETECPFSQLQILQKANEAKTVYFNMTAKQSLPPSIFAAACFSYADSYIGSDQVMISLHQLAYGMNSPGVAFKVSESDVGNYLNEATKTNEGFSLVNVLGNYELHFKKPPDVLFMETLEEYYRRRDDK
jgi:hypothetical protein